MNFLPMALIPRSLRLPPPFRGRTIRYFADKAPPLKACRLWSEDAWRGWVAARGRRQLEAGRTEGRRFLTAISAHFCGIGHSWTDSIRSPRNLLFVLADGQNCRDQTAHVAQQRADFLAHGRWQHLPVHHEPGRLNVALHIRRGDVAAMKSRDQGNWRLRFLGLDWFAGVLATVLENHRAERPLFHVYSQGQPDDFADLGRGFDLRLHLDAGDQESLFNMSRADVLALSPSTFSFLAAILSQGHKIARIPWWHHLPEQSDWTLLPADHFGPSAGRQP